MPVSDLKRHWQNIYSTTIPQVTWRRPHRTTSLCLIKRAGPSAAIIDVGGGESTLIDDLFARGYREVTVLDIPQTAIDVTKKRPKELAERLDGITEDVTKANLAPSAYDVWHDRAVFHFLRSKAQRMPMSIQWRARSSMAVM